MSNIKTVTVSPLDFGYMMIGHKDIYPLEVVGSIECEDKKGVFYIPTVTNYTDTEEILYTTGNANGYETRQGLLELVGLCWDLAVKDIEKQKLLKTKDY